MHHRREGSREMTAHGNLIQKKKKENEREALSYYV
jgi:hypothetical protein